jgi:hypothetical protein
MDIFSGGFTPGDVGHAIQLALAPVFLLTGIGALMNVMTGRLGRIIDRGRYLTENPLSGAQLSGNDVRHELHNLSRRLRAAHAAISMCTFSALLVCAIVCVLFLDALLSASLRWLIGTLFLGSALALVVGLGFFQHEVYLAMRTVRITAARVSAEAQDLR